MPRPASKRKDLFAEKAKSGKKQQPNQLIKPLIVVMAGLVPAHPRGHAAKRC
jgi:hypothetical protein